MRSENAFFVILRELGVLVSIVGVMAICAIPVSLYFGEYYALWPVLATAGASFILSGRCSCPFGE